MYFGVSSWRSDKQVEKTQVIRGYGSYTDMTLQGTHLPRNVHKTRQQQHIVPIVIHMRF
jgi:hypothetical protein